METQAIETVASAPELVPVAVVIPLFAVLVVAVGADGLRRFKDSASAVRFVIAAAVWIAVSGLLGRSGVLGHFDARPPPAFPFMVTCLVVGVACGLSSWGGAIAQRAPFAAIVAAQAFRFPLELAMHDAANRGIMPVELSFTGYNFDVVTGALAFVVAGLAFVGKAPRALLWAWNAIGIAALLTIVAIAVATTPVVHAFGTDPAHLNTWVAQLPYVWLPAVLVAFAVAGHIVMTRALLLRR